MTPKEALENVKHEIQQRLNDMVVDGCDLGSVLAIESFIRSNLEVVEKALTELEELKRDVKRYFELLELMDFDWENFTEHGFNELNAIETKLSKVGKDIGK